MWACQNSSTGPVGQIFRSGYLAFNARNPLCHWLLPGTDRGAQQLGGTDDACARIEPCLLSAHRLFTGRMPVKLAP